MKVLRRAHPLEEEIGERQIHIAADVLFEGMTPSLDSLKERADPAPMWWIAVPWTG